MAVHVVTGGSGFVGNHIAKALKNRCEEVIVYDLIDTPDRSEDIEYIQGDILDYDRVLSTFKEAEYVHHNVALVPLTKAGKRFWAVNVVGTKIALEAAEKAGIKKFVHMSSSAVFGIPDDCPITEKTRLSPIEIYGRAKYAGELEVTNYMLANKPAAIIRPRTIVGGHGRLGIFQILFEWINENRKIYIIGKGDNLFQFVHIHDIVEADILAAYSPINGIYNIGSACYGTLREELESIINYAESRSSVVSLPVKPAISALKFLDYIKLSPLAPWHYLTYHKPFVFDTSKAQKELGWNPRYGNQELLRESYDWYIRNYNDWKTRGESSLHRKSVKQGMLKLLKLLP